MNEKYLDLELKKYGDSDFYPFHMPGHKRQSMAQWGDWDPEKIDVTEIEGTDNLHHAVGILAEAQKRMARIFGAYKSFMLVNGSSCGLLAAISAAVRHGERILVARNCHKAVYHAICLLEAKADFLYPMETESGIQGSISVEDLKDALARQTYAAVLVTSPTYDGVVSDIAALAKEVHRYGIPLIVDEAHGAHFGFSEYFPQKAIRQGADYCIESLHKTLPSFTQTAVLHIADSPYVKEERLKKYLQIYQTSSPSYILMAGMDRCSRILQESGQELFAAYESNLREFYQRTAGLQHLQVLYPVTDAGRLSYQHSSPIWQKDPSKILISGSKIGWSGEKIAAILREKYHLEMEMEAGFYATALTGLLDTREGFRRLAQALQEMDLAAGQQSEALQKRAEQAEDTAITKDCYLLSRSNKKCFPIYEAFGLPSVSIPLERAAGKVSGDFVYLYPPGIPLLAPGEQISPDMVEALQHCLQQGLNLTGIEAQKIMVLTEALSN